MNSRVKALENTKAFVEYNLTQIVKEYVVWQKTDKLEANGYFREAASMLDNISTVGHYGRNDYVSGRLNIITSMMVDSLLKDYQQRAGLLGENI